MTEGRPRGRGAARARERTDNLIVNFWTALNPWAGGGGSDSALRLMAASPGLDPARKLKRRVRQQRLSKRAPDSVLGASQDQERAAIGRAGAGKKMATRIFWSDAGQRWAKPSRINQAQWTGELWTCEKDQDRFGQRCGIRFDGAGILSRLQR